MDQNNKLIISLAAGLFLICAVVFVIMIVGYVPEPKKTEATSSQSENLSQHTNTTKIKQAEDPFLPENPIDIPAVQSVNSSKSDVKVRVKNSDDSPVIGLDCMIGIVTREPFLLTEVIFSKKTDDKGECYFYGLEPNKDYQVDFFSQQDRQFHALIEVNNLEPGKTFEKEVQVQLNIDKNACITSGSLDLYSKGYVEENGKKIYDACVTGKDQVTKWQCDNIQGKSQSASNVFNCPFGCVDGACLRTRPNTNNSEISCTDSDGGINYYEKGKTSGNHEDICFKDKNWAPGVNYDKNGLIEVYCGSMGAGTQTLTKEYSCPNGCKEGACIK